MKQTLRLIALRTTRVNDRTSILSAYSLEQGRVSFAVNAGGGREARRRRALLMPLGLVECQADFRPGRDISYMSEPRPLIAMDMIYSHPVKNAIALFLAEFLSLVLRESASDPARFAFIAGAVGRLASASGREAANFHICFLIRLGRFMGIEPDFASWSEDRLFDMTDGIFKSVGTASPRSRLLSREDSCNLCRLSRITFDNSARFRFSRDERNRTIDMILEFYSFHLVPLGTLRSLDVLRSLF